MQRASQGVFQAASGKTLTNKPGKAILKSYRPQTVSDSPRLPRSRGISGALYLQSAIAGVMSCLGLSDSMQPSVSSDDVWVLRSKNL